MARKANTWKWLAWLAGGVAVGSVTLIVLRKRASARLAGATPVWSTPALPSVRPAPRQSTEQVFDSSGRNVGRAIQEDINRIYSRLGFSNRVDVDGIVGANTRSAWNALVRMNNRCDGAPAVFIGSADNSTNNANPRKLMELSESTLYAIEMLITDPAAQQMLAACLANA